MVYCTPFSVIITVCDVRSRVGDGVGAVSGSVCVPIEQLRFVFDRAAKVTSGKIFAPRSIKETAKLQRARET